MSDANPASRVIVPALMACAAAAPGAASAAGAAAPQSVPLTIDRLFDAPALSGPSLSGIAISPDGSRILFLKGSDRDKDRLDLWQYDPGDGQTRLLVDSKTLAPTPVRLSEEERGRRERQRTAAFSGILEYSLARSGHALLIPIDGRLYYCDLAHPERPAVRPITPPGEPVTDASLAPTGDRVAFIRGQNLIVHDLADDAERALTHDGGGTVKNGMAEYVAQEEMDRFTGYWWSPKGDRIAFIRVDESAIPVAQRFEVDGDEIHTFAQRYPAAGGPNATVRLGVVDVRSGVVTWIDLGPETDFYLARVNWLPDGRTLAVQRQSRDQRRLDLMFADSDAGTTHVVLSETSTSWTHLNDELTFLTHSREFIWASSRDGYQHLYLYDYAGRLLRRLTAGPWCVDDFRVRAIKGVDEKHRLVYFTATEKSPVERHLYRTSLDTRDPAAVARITREDGIHGVTMARNTRFYVDQFTSRLQPPQVSVHNADGTLRAYLSENRLDDRHPDAPYAAENSVPEFGTLTAADGQTLYYRIFKPAHFDPARRHPAVVEVYGGPQVQRVLDNWTGNTFTQILTRAGFVVFQLDNRGSASRGTAFEAPIQNHLGEIEVADQSEGARWLARQPFIDPARIGVWGWSYGGYLTLMLMFKAPELFRAGVAGAPVTDWSLYDTHYTERYLGDPVGNAAGYEASSVLPYASGLRGPLLVMHGMADDNVLFVNSTKLLRTLQDLGKPFDVMVYPGGKHGLTRERAGRHAYATVLRFFEEHLARDR